MLNMIQLSSLKQNPENFKNPGTTQWSSLEPRKPFKRNKSEVSIGKKITKFSKIKVSHQSWEWVNIRIIPFHIWM